MTVATTEAPASTRTSSTTVVRPSSVPPAAPKATPASAAPRKPALAAAETRELDTGQRQVGQSRHAPPQHHHAACRCQQPPRDQGQQERQGHALGRARRLEQAVPARVDQLACDPEATLV